MEVPPECIITTMPRSLAQPHMIAASSGSLTEPRPISPTILTPSRAISSKSSSVKPFSRITAPPRTFIPPGRKLAQDLAAKNTLDRLGWKSVRRRYEEEKLALHPPDTRGAFATAAKHVEDLLAPVYLDQLDAATMSRFQAALFGKGLAVASVASYLREIRAFLNWADRMIPGFTAPRIR